MGKKIKLLYISQATGGVQRHVISVLSKINRDVFDIAGICPPQDLISGVSEGKESFLEAFKRIGVRAYPVVMSREINPVSDIKSFLKVYDIIKRERFDIVHAHSSKAGVLGRIAGRLAGIPAVVYTPHSFPFDRPRRMLLSRSLYAAIEKFAGFFCDKVIAVSEGEKELAVRSGVLPARKIIVIENAVEPVVLNIDSVKKRKEAGVGPEDRVIIFVGRMAPQKAPLDLVSAAEKACRIFPDAKFLLLGDGPLCKKISALIKEKGLSGSVLFLGWRNDARELIAASDIFILPSLWEGCNYSLLDAVAMGKPVITTDVAGVKGVVEDGVNGFIIPKGRPDLLSEAIIKMLKMSRGRLEEMGNNSMAMARKRIPPEGVAKDLEKLYLELIKR
ncbi:MAG: glycosyltransferase family 4 protein [Candidatus Omnitrophica bacterium]|nr:glycosyltransferase family 4 protein [Candidatus Omnitrophota bacterium]